MNKKLFHSLAQLLLVDRSILSDSLKLWTEVSGSGFLSFIVIQHTVYFSVSLCNIFSMSISLICVFKELSSAKQNILLLKNILQCQCSLVENNW